MSYFQTGHYDKVISTLQAQFKDNIGHVVDIVFAHTQYRFDIFAVILYFSISTKTMPIWKSITLQLCNTLITMLNINFYSALLFKATKLEKIHWVLYCKSKIIIFFVSRFRNIVITTLLDQVWANEPRLTKDLKPILRELTNLVRGETSTVSLKARTILVRI